MVLNSEQFREKVEREKGKILSGSKKRGHDGKNDDDDDDEFDDNDDRVYRDSEGKVIPSFKTRADGTVNNLLKGTYDLNKLWGTDSNKESQYSSVDEDRKEADSTLNRCFKNIESVVNRENRFVGNNKEGIETEDEPLDQGGWLVFSKGLSERKKNTLHTFEAKIRKKGLHSIENYELMQYLKTKECETLMEDNEITIHVATGYILLDVRAPMRTFTNF